MGRKKRLLLLCVLAVLLLYLGAGTGWGGALSQWLDRRAAAGQARAAAIALGETAAQESAPAEPEETPDTVAETAPAAETVPPAAEGTDPAAGEAPTMTPDGVAIQATTIAGGLKLNNATSYDLDVEALLAEALPLKLPAEGPQILIIHTHDRRSKHCCHRNTPTAPRTRSTASSRWDRPWQTSGRRQDSR